jgi:DNA-binding transcriptional regulator YdaS (Cro superfamily)
MDTKTSDLIRTAIRLFGTQQALAEAVGISQPVISRAIKLGRVGPRLAFGLDRVTKGEVPKSALRPDLWPPTERRGHEKAWE